jgi:CBS domain containing-hemolysin-like protein
MPTVYPKRELIKMVEDQKNSGQSDIDSDEESIVKGALSYSNTRVSEIMTPRSEVVTLKENQKLTKSLLTEIRLTGHSRIPVKSKDTDEIVGLLYTKDLLDKAGKNLTLGEIARRRVYSVTPETQLDDLLNRLRDTHCHLFIVRQKSGGALVGVVTIEDVMEEIIGHEILDEFEKPADTAKI